MIYGEADIEPIDQSEDLWWVFYLPPDDPSPDYRQLVGAFGGLGCEVVGADIDDAAESGDGHPFQALLFDPLHQQHFTIMSAGGSHLFLGMHARQFLPAESPEARACADVFLEYAKECIRVCRPLYAYVENLDLFPDTDEIEAGRITHVFWAQYFGHELTEAIGRRVLSEAPAWRNENVWGGILYVLAASPFLRSEPREYWYAARSYFLEQYPRPLVWRD